MGSVRIGTAERKDIFEANMKVAQSQPAPGEYQDDTTTIGKGLGNVYMGIKLEKKIEELPGPGDYDHDASIKVKQSDPKFVFGTEQRSSNFNSKQKEIPGPGQYSDSQTQFKTTTRGGFIGKASRDDDWEYVTEEEYLSMTKQSGRRKRGARRQ